MLCYNMKDRFLNETVNNTTFYCSICLRDFIPSSSNYTKCCSCGLLVEISCFSSFFPRVPFSMNWNCPHCDKGEDKTAVCEICGYARGFLCPLQIPKTTSDHWIHPFCGCFHKEFKRNKEENFFIWESEEHMSKLHSKSKEKQYKKLCEYCKRDIGHTNQCTTCARSPIHAICAYKANALQAVINPSKQKLTIKKILCPNCNTARTIKKRSMERVLDAPTSEYQLMEDSRKGVLEGVIDLITEADILEVLKYNKSIINLLPEVVEVIYELV